MRIKVMIFWGIFLFILCVGKSQDFYTNKVWVTVIDSIVISDANRKNLSESNEINRVLEQHQVFEYKQVFPFAKTPELRNVYELTFNGNRENLIKSISDMKSLFSNCELVYKPQILYNPADWAWWNTVTNNITDGWLWYLVKIDASKAWDITRGNSDIRIAIVDVDGFDYDHPDLRTKIHPPYDFYNGNRRKGEHGTSVASLLAGETVDAGEIPRSAAFAMPPRICLNHDFHKINKITMIKK